MKTLVTGVTWTCAFVLALSVYMYGGAHADEKIRIPKFPRAMKLDTFLSEIATGRTYEELYVIIDASDLPVGPLQAFTTTLTAESSSFASTQVTRRLDGRLPGGKCITATAQIHLVAQQSPYKRAIFDMTSGTGSDVRRIFYFTTKPDEYLAEFRCLRFENNDCKGGFFVNLYTVRAPPNQFDWERAVKDIRGQVGLDFTDPRSLYTFRTADACPDP